MTSVEVKTTGGVVASADPTAHGGVHAFLGIPYAESPLTAERRFLAPVPARWDGVRTGDTYGASAPQPAQGFTIIPEPIIRGDNCLNLNVFSPDVGSNAGGMPVLVYIHGGGFTNGCNGSAWYHGRGFGPDGIVVVAINYRLGFEGFLAVDGSPGNLALRDWLLALEWVNDNIAGFGGDPGNVTIMGQSAGGVACATLLATPRAKGLFRRAILMSGGLSHLRTLDDMRRYTANAVASRGLSATRDDAARLSPDALVGLQQERGPKKERGDGEHPVVRAYGGLLGGMRFGPVVDGDLLPEDPLTAVRAGAASGIEVLAGSTADEVNKVVRLEGVDEQVAHDALRALGMTEVQATTYREAHKSSSPASVLGRARTDAMFRVPAARLLDALAGDGTFGYEFQWRSPSGFGSVHCLDIPFAMNLLDAEKVAVVAGDDPPRSLADDVHGAWVNFVSSGDPGWPSFDAERRTVMLYDTPESAVANDHAAVARAAFEGVVR